VRAPCVAAAAALVATHGVSGAEIPEPPPKQWIGMGAVIVPSGTLTIGDPGGSQDLRMAVAYGAEVVIERTILERTFVPSLSWMLAPRILTNVRASESALDPPDSWRQLDLRLGVRTSAPLRPNVELFGYAAAGYSIVIVPNGETEASDPQGLLLAAGLGVGYRWSRSAMARLSLGYQYGFQKTTYMDIDYTYKDRLLDVTVGILAALD
jgi:hypothetical protein